MDVLSLSPLPAGAVAWRMAGDRPAVTVVCKATYTLAPGISPLAEVQEPLHAHDVHWDDDPTKSVVAPSDLVPFKPRADVVLVGHAYAPEKKPVQSIIARLGVGEIDKSVAVFGQRMVSQDGTVLVGAAWTRMPLRWEYAAGGPDTWNPVGIGPDASPGSYGQRLLPNLQRPDVHVLAQSDILAPVGFGPLAERWLVRRERLGRYFEEPWNRVPLGDDFDWLYFQVAPTDQQRDPIPADARIILEHLHPDHARFVTNLSGVAPHALVDLPGSAPRELPLTADTLWIDTTRAICTLTWRGQIALNQPDAPGRAVIVLAPSGQTPAWSSVAPLLDAGTAGTASSAAAPPPRAARNPMPARQASRRVTVSAVISTAPTVPFHDPKPGDISPAAVSGGPAQPAPGRRSTLEMQGVVPPPLPSWLAPAKPLEPPATLGAPSMPASSAPLPVHQASRLQALSTPRGGPTYSAPEPDTEATLRLGDTNRTGLALAAYAGVAEASDAAAGRSARDSLPPDSRRGEEASASQPKAPKESPPPPALELLWFNADPGHRLRRAPEWAPFFSPRPSAKKSTSVLGLSFGPDAAGEASRVTRADVLRLLMKAPLTTGEGARRAMSRAFGPEGDSMAPFLLFEGELELRFDTEQELRMVIEAARPLASNDRKLKELLDAADEALRSSAFSSPQVIDGFLGRIREAWGKANKHLPPDYLAAQAERVLLSQRRYQTRSVLNGSYLRALLSATEMGAQTPVYVPLEAAGHLPLFSRFQARVLAEAHPRQDQYETHAVALRAVALARVLPPAWGLPGKDGARP